MHWLWGSIADHVNLTSSPPTPTSIESDHERVLGYSCWHEPVTPQKNKTKTEKKNRTTCELLLWANDIKLQFKKLLKTVINEYFNGLLKLHFSKFLKLKKTFVCIRMLPVCYSYASVCYLYVRIRM